MTPELNGPEKHLVLPVKAAVTWSSQVALCVFLIADEDSFDYLSLVSRLLDISLSE